MVEELRQEPVQGPHIQRLADINHAVIGEYVTNERVLRFRFTPDQDFATRRQIAERIFRSMYEGNLIADQRDLADYHSITPIAFGEDVVEKPVKTDEEMSDEDRETSELIQKYLRYVSIPPKRYLVD